MRFTFPLILICTFFSSGFAENATPIFTVNENGDFIYSTDYKIIKVEGGVRSRVTDSPSSKVGFCYDLTPINKEDFHVNGHVLYSQTGKIDTIKIQSTTNTVFSISDVYWPTDDHICLQLEINPSVAELQVINVKDGVLVHSYVGTNFSPLNSGECPVYCSLRPPGTPPLVPVFLFLGDVQIATLAPGEALLSNILTIRRSKEQLEIIFISSNNKVIRQDSCIVNPDAPVIVPINRKQAPRKENAKFPIWNLSVDKNGNIVAE